MRILLLEDDPETASALARGMLHDGHEVSAAGDVHSALRILDDACFDAAVLDVMVPGGTGYDVLARIKNESPATPVLVLTARGAVHERIEGLDLGADDYLVKPFSFGELLARLRAMRRRSAGEAGPLRSGPLELDPLRRVATVHGRRIDLTPTEFNLIATLVRAGGSPVGRRELLREVWGYDFDPSTNLVDVHVNRLRRKLESAGAGLLVRTVRGLGYAMG